MIKLGFVGGRLISLASPLIEPAHLKQPRKPASELP
jgi:hypothetical protein